MNQEATMEKTPKSAAEALEEFGAAADELFLAICKAFYIDRACEVLDSYIKSARVKIRDLKCKIPGGKYGKNL